MDMSAAPAVAADDSQAQVEDSQVREYEEAEEHERALNEEVAAKYEEDRAAEEQEEAARRLMLEDEERKQVAKGQKNKAQAKAKEKGVLPTILTLIQRLP